MTYTPAQISKIIQKIISKARYELELAQDDESIEAVMEKYGVSLEEAAVSVDPKISKILVFGALGGKSKTYQMVAKKMGIPEANIVFENDYEKLTNYDTAKLEYSSEYSDIIIGAIPHKLAGMEDKNGLIAKIRQEPEKYPRVNISYTSDKLKISITSFKDCLSKTRYFELCSTT